MEAFYGIALVELFCGRDLKRYVSFPFISICQRQKIKPAYYCEDGLELREYDYEKRPLLKVLILTTLCFVQLSQNQYF